MHFLAKKGFQLFIYYTVRTELDTLDAKAGHVVVL